MTLRAIDMKEASIDVAAQFRQCVSFAKAKSCVDDHLIEKCQLGVDWKCTLSIGSLGTGQCLSDQRILSNGQPAIAGNIFFDDQTLRVNALLVDFVGNRVAPRQQPQRVGNRELLQAGVVVDGPRQTANPRTDSAGREISVDLLAINQLSGPRVGDSGQARSGDVGVQQVSKISVRVADRRATPSVLPKYIDQDGVIPAWRWCKQFLGDNAAGEESF